MENEKLTEFAIRVKTMSVEQLQGYKAAAINLNRILSVLGVSFIFLIMSYPVFPIIFCGTILVYLFGKTSEGLSRTLMIVKAQLAKLENT